MVSTTSNLSTATMTELSLAKDNKYTIHYFPFHGCSTALRAILYMSGAEHTFTHPTVSVCSLLLFYCYLLGMIDLLVPSFNVLIIDRS
jgi:hypothetical protein